MRSSVEYSVVELVAFRRSLENGDENVGKFRKAKHGRTGSGSKRVLSGREREREYIVCAIRINAEGWKWRKREDIASNISSGRGNNDAKRGAEMSA